MNFYNSLFYKNVSCRIDIEVKNRKSWIHFNKHQNEQGCGLHRVREGRVRTPPRFENFQLFPAKIVRFFQKKVFKIENMSLHPPTCKKSYMDPSQFLKTFNAPPTFFSSPHPCVHPYFGLQSPKTGPLIGTLTCSLPFELLSLYRYATRSSGSDGM